MENLYMTSKFEKLRYLLNIFYVVQNQLNLYIAGLPDVMTYVNPALISVTYVKPAANDSNLILYPLLFEELRTNYKLVFFCICLFFFNKLHLFQHNVFFHLIIIDFNPYSNLHFPTYYRIHMMSFSLYRLSFQVRSIMEPNQILPVIILWILDHKFCNIDQILIQRILRESELIYQFSH